MNTLPHKWALDWLRTDLALRKTATTLNRVLGWALLAQPLVALLTGWRWIDALPWAAALFVAHGLLSVALWGGPKPIVPAHRSQAPHANWAGWFGGFSFRHAGQRERFLTGAWAVALCVLWPLACLAFVYILAAVLPVEESWLWWPVGIGAWALSTGFSLRYPFAVFAHVSSASAYALRRTGRTGRTGRSGHTNWLARGAAPLLAGAYLAASVWHLLSGW